LPARFILREVVYLAPPSFLNLSQRYQSGPHAEVERPERSLTALEPDGTLITVIEMSLSSWLVAGIVPGIERQPLKKLAVDESALLKLLHRWREEAEKAGRRSASP